tara:strand:+ start:5031 stop:5597 length:567 start_codon:yes stop_codon:yes gene_type:complete
LNRKKNIKQLTESEVISLSKKKSKHFGILYDRYFEQIFRFVFKRLGGNEHIAGDLTQQTFIKAMANLHKYEDRGFPFSSWLYRIAQNEVSMYFRSQKKVFTVEINENQLSGVTNEAKITSYMSSRDQEKLIEMMNGLEPEHLDIIELRFFQEMSFKEIAEIYSISEANAKMRTYRILEKIAKKWKEKQ